MASIIYETDNCCAEHLGIEHGSAAFRALVKPWKTAVLNRGKNSFFICTKTPLLTTHFQYKLIEHLGIFDLIWPRFGAPQWVFWPQILLKSQMPHICPGSPPLGLNIYRCIITKLIHKPKAVNKNISIEETVIIWFAFKPGLELTGFRTTRFYFQQVNMTWARHPIDKKHLVKGQLY